MLYLEGPTSKMSACCFAALAYRVRNGGLTIWISFLDDLRSSKHFSSQVQNLLRGPRRATDFGKCCYTCPPCKEKARGLSVCSVYTSRWRLIALDRPGTFVFE